MNPRRRLRHDTFDNFDIKLGILNKISETKFSVGCILYGLAVMQTISNSTSIKNIDKIQTFSLAPSFGAHNCIYVFILKENQKSNATSEKLRPHYKQPTCYHTPF